MAAVAPEHAAAEKTLTQLKATVASLDADVQSLAAAAPRTPRPPDYDTRVRTASEHITQALLRVDSVTISKDAAAAALRAGDRHTSRLLSVLLARRKTVVKKLTDLGDRVDAIVAAAAAADAKAEAEAEAEAEGEEEKEEEVEADAEVEAQTEVDDPPGDAADDANQIPPTAPDAAPAPLPTPSQS